MGASHTSIVSEQPRRAGSGRSRSSCAAGGGSPAWPLCHQPFLKRSPTAEPPEALTSKNYSKGRDVGTLQGKGSWQRERGWHKTGLGGGGQQCCLHINKLLQKKEVVSLLQSRTVTGHRPQENHVQKPKLTGGWKLQHTY